MIEIIGVRFKANGKVYYFSPGDHQFQTGDLVVVETSKGMECGEVTIPNKTIQQSAVVQPLKQILRPVNKEDRKTLEQNRKKEIRAFHICEEKIAMRKLEMKLIEVECAFDNSKLLFYFTAENRVDFRDLVKDLAAIFRTRIELRQIGVRDKAKILGGIGICGREFCCKGFLCEFQPVSIKMAKEQGLSLNPAKISGCCGRLMCCLKHDLFLMLPFFKFKTCRIPWNNTAEIDFIKRDPVFYFSFIAFKQCFRILYIKINQNTISPSAICLYQMQWKFVM